MNNGQVKPLYVYNNLAYAQFNNGLYPVQATSNLLGNLRLQRVPNSRPLTFPTPLNTGAINKVRFTNLITKNRTWWGFGPVRNTTQTSQVLIQSANNMNKVITPAQSQYIFNAMPQSIQHGINFLMQTKNKTPVIDIQDETGLSQVDKQQLKRKIGENAYNFVIENWKKLSSGNKNIFKTVGTSVASGFTFYAAEILLGAGWVAVTGTPPPPALGMILRSGKKIASGGL